MSSVLAQNQPPTMGGRLPPGGAPPPSAKGQAHPPGAPGAQQAQGAPPNPRAPLPVWSCSFQPTTEKGGGQLDNLTVGAKFQMSCHGDIPVLWRPDGVGINFPTADWNYTLKVLKNIRLEPNAADFLVTAYKAGKFEPEYIQIMQDTIGFEFLKPTWEVKSVLKQGEQPKPYPSYGPWSLSLPLWFWLALGAVLVTIIYFTTRTIRRYSQRNKMLGELERHKTALSPLHQYYKDSRILRRKLHAVKQTEELGEISKELNKEFRLYVLRQFQIPTLDWSDREIVRDMKKRHRKVYYRVREPLRKTLRELAKISSQKQILFKDVEQLQRMSLETVEKIDQARGTGSKR